MVAYLNGDRSLYLYLYFTRPWPVEHHNGVALLHVLKDVMLQSLQRVVHNEDVRTSAKEITTRRQHRHHDRHQQQQARLLHLS